MWLFDGFSHCLYHGGQPRVGKPQATRSLLTGRLRLDGGIADLSSLGLTRKKRNFSSSLFPKLLGCTMCTPLRLALSCWPHWWLCFLGSTSYCWIAIVCRLLCLKLKTCGQRLTWHDIQHIRKVAFQRLTH